MKRCHEIILNIVMWLTVFPAMLFGLIMVLGMLIDTVAENSEQHDRCSKRAVNVYEIKKCG